MKLMSHGGGHDLLKHDIKQERLLEVCAMYQYSPVEVGKGSGGKAPRNKSAI